MESILNEAAQIARFVSANFLRVLPFLAVSVPLAVAFKHTGMRDRIRAVLDRGPVLAVLIATAVGAFSPFCSCSVIPLIAALLGSGVPLAPVMSFWLASPSMDPEILLMSAGVVGWQLAWWRLGATFLMSLGAGLLTMVLERRGLLGGGLLRESRSQRQPVAAPSVPPSPRPPETALAPALAFSAAAPAALAAGGAGSSGSRGAPRAFAGEAKSWVRALRKIDLRALAVESAQTAVRFALLMALAFVLEALIVRFVPQTAVAAVLGRGSAFAVPLATLVGIPLYTTNLSALGIVAGLMRQGMDAAAALAFLIGGAVTTIPAMAAVFGVVKPRVFALYLGFAVAGSVAAGYAFKLIGLLS